MTKRPVGLRRKYAVPEGFRPVSPDIVLALLTLIHDANERGPRPEHARERERLVRLHGVIDVERSDRIALAMFEGRYHTEGPEAVQ